MTKTLGDAESKVARYLVTGHAPSIASAVMEMKSVMQAVLGIVSQTVSNECGKLCQKLSDDGPSQFRAIPVTDLAGFTWGAFIKELEIKAPTLMNIFTSIVSFSDHRNKTKAGSGHHPGICTALAILLKERNREMCGIQSLVSMMMYFSHCEKQVGS